MRLGTILLALTLAAFWVVFLRPTSLGGPANYVMVHGPSMQPLLYTGDLVLTRTKPTYQVGDIVAFHVPRGNQGEGTVVIHRIIDGDGVNGYITQGDNKDFPDLWRPVDSDVLGEQWFHLPGAGKYLAAFRQPLVMGAVLLLLLSLSLKSGLASRRGVRSSGVLIVRSS